MPTIAEFFDQPDIKGKFVAARLSNPKSGFQPDLHYHVFASSQVIPPSVYVIESMEAGKVQPKGKTMVNYAPTTWLNANGVQEEAFGGRGLETYGTAKPITVNMERWGQFSLAKLGPKPKSVSIYDDTTSRGSSRARRVYMLASFCLLKLAGTLKGWKSNGHNIASMLVADDGEVLSWGVNDGAFRHAEVNTIISYFLRNDRAASLPKKSVLFTTLKPCQMCSNYIKSSWGTGEIKIWFGMKDSGMSGGTPLLGDKAQEFGGEDVEYDIWKDWTEEEMDVSGTKPVNVQGKGGKIDLTAALDREEGKRTKSAADWVDTSSEIADLFNAAHDKFVKKANKGGREEGPMKEALAHLGPWLK
jgi:tRNA(Arg) A34 adenosine deaminase TadA